MGAAGSQTAANGVASSQTVTEGVTGSQIAADRGAGCSVGRDDLRIVGGDGLRSETERKRKGDRKKSGQVLYFSLGCANGKRLLCRALLTA